MHVLMYINSSVQHIQYIVGKSKLKGGTCTVSAGKIETWVVGTLTNRRDLSAYRTTQRHPPHIHIYDCICRFL
jgi:hypothetical protein